MKYQIKGWLNETELIEFTTEGNIFQILRECKVSNIRVIYIKDKQ